MAVVYKRNVKQSQYTLLIPKHKTAIFDRSFIVSACRTLNKFRKEVDLRSSIYTLKGLIKLLFLNIQTKQYKNQK